MVYTIIHGSLQYDRSITEEIFKDLIACAESQGFKFNNHWSNGGNTYEHFKRHRYLNFNLGKKPYDYGNCYVIDNNSQGMNIIHLKDLEKKEEIINNYQIY